MVDLPIEASYPLNFRQKDAQKLGDHLRLRHCVEIIGARRVGIANLLRFFLYHTGIAKRYIDSDQKHMFCAVDLNDLVEREIFPFWVLTFKRLVDTVEKFPIEPTVKKNIATLFLDAIQSNDLFLTIESLREAIILVVSQNIYPTFFFIRFDRLKDATNNEFFANLEGLVDATGQKLAYVFTSFRDLDALSPTVFPRRSLSVFSNVMYLKPAEADDMQIIFETFEARYNIAPSKEVLSKIVELSGGHVQYLYLCLIIINQKIREKKQKIQEGSLLKTIATDERTVLQSEEIWDSLTGFEQAILKKIASGKKITADEKTAGKYLWDTGIISSQNRIFSPLFANYLRGKDGKDQAAETVEFTKKENALFKILSGSLSEVCEREKIIEAVWSEDEEVGVSDWTIDKLVARVRTKLKLRKSKYQVVTVKTRGFKLIEGTHQIER